MKIIFLGTGTSQGIPTIGSSHPVCLSKNKKDKRLRSSILIEKNNKYLLIDCSPDFRYQMLRANYNDLNAILITHEHYDHIGGLEDIRPINRNNIKSSSIKTIPVYSLQRVLKKLKKRFFYLFEEEKKNNTFDISLHKLEKNKKFFPVDSINVIPLLVWHGFLPIFGFRIENSAYITDASDIPNCTISKLKGLDNLILNVLRKKNKNYFFSLLETVNIIKKIRPKKAYLTHISYMLGFHEEIQEKLPKNIYVAYDGLEI